MSDDPMPNGWSQQRGPSPVACCVCGSAIPHPDRQSLWIVGSDRYVVCTFRHVQETASVQRLAGKGFPVHLHRGPMTDAERVTWETR